MQIWEERPITTANLLNPAFCGELIRRCADSYYEETNKPVPYVLLFLMLPIILHKTTRDSLPKTSRKSLHEWLEKNQFVKIGFVDRCQQMVPFVKEALMFLLQNNAIEFDEKGNISVLKFQMKKINEMHATEINECYNKSKLIGKLLAKSGKPETIYSLFGVKP